MKSPRVRYAILVVFLFIFGLHCIRVFLPSVIWYLSGSLPTEMLALYALGTFALVWFVPLIRRGLGDAGSLALAGGGLILARLALQFSSQAIFDLVFSTLGIVLFLWLLPLIHQSSSNREKPGTIAITTIAIPLALVIDVASRTLLWSYDLTWRRTPWAILLAVAILLFAAVLLALEVRRPQEKRSSEEPGMPRSLGFAVIGPWLYLMGNILFNPQAVSAASSWPDSPGYLLVNLLAFLGSMVALCTASRQVKRETLWVVLSAIALTAGLVLVYLQIAPAFVWIALAAISGSACLGWTLEVSARDGATRPGLWRTTLATFIGFIIFLVAVLMNEYNMRWITPAVGGIIGILAVVAVVSRRADPMPARDNRPAFVVAVSVGLVALLVVDMWTTRNDKPEAIAATPGQPLKVMTYNIHQGLDAGIHMDLEEIIQVIVEQNPDVIGLNEVNRGRANNGYVDTLGLLSHRLNMPYVYGGNFADGQYGNAILSRYPILEWENTHYQVNTTEVRGIVHAIIDTKPAALQVFSTHLDHIGSKNNARAAQIDEALRLWDNAPHTLLMGDLNATPDAVELAALYDTSLVDVLEASGHGEDYTFWNPPDDRIDYIFATPDLPFDTVNILPVKASDHLPVIVVFKP
ncbi:MAG TPA: endonuclease/exonuclease/phosphatase family protein [Anaerolineaceae bacterium]|nr:endonuclease/exonuclease/phosphatase family protein [Anaerolineaceae bacterium]